MNRMAMAMSCAVLFVSGCGGGTSAPAAAPGPTPTPTATSGGAGSGARGFPGVSGLLAQVEGTTLQVQGTDTQTAVTYSPATTLTETVAAARSGIRVGVCVQARSARTAPGAGGSTPPTTPTMPSAPAGPILAASVEISPEVKGACPTPGELRTPGARPPGATGDAMRPSGSPTSRRAQGGGSGFGGNGFGGNGFSAFGKVTAVDDAGFRIESSLPRDSTGSAAVPATRTVRTSTATTYTRTQAANAKALVVGLCVTALGRVDDTGSIAATSIALRPAENGSCSSGLGRRGPGGNPIPAGGGPGA